jgi:hypothetical protein
MPFSMIQVHCIGFPHSDTDIYCGCIRLNVAFRSIPRPSSARDAKTSSMSPYSLCPCDTEKRMVLCVSTCHPDTAANRIPVALYLMSCHIQLLRCCSREERWICVRPRHKIDRSTASLDPPHFQRSKKPSALARPHLTTAAMKNLPYLFSSTTTPAVK